MRRLLYLAGGITAGLVLVRLFRRRRAGDAAPPARLRAAKDELQEKLAATRADTAREAGEDVEPPAGEPPPAGDVDEARRRVHAEGRAAVEEMRRGGDEA